MNFRSLLSAPKPAEAARLPRFLIAAGLALLCWASLGRVSAAELEPSLTIETGTHTGPIRRLAVSPSGRLLVTASDDKTARLWDPSTGAPLGVLRVPLGPDQVGKLYGAAISPDGSVVALGGTTADAGGKHRIYLFDLPSGGYRRSFDARGGDIRNLAWSPNGQLVAAVYAGTPALRVFDAEGSMLFEQQLAADSYGLSFSSQSQLAVTTFDGKVRLYRTEGRGWIASGEIATPLNDPVSVRHSPDGSLLAVGYFSRPARGPLLVDVFDSRSLALQRRIEVKDLPFGNLMNVAWQADGRALIAGGTGYREAETFAVKRISWPDGKIDEVVVARNSILDLAALPDGRMAFASFDSSWGLVDGDRRPSASAGGTARFWSADTLRLSADGSVVGWSFDRGAKLFYFSLAAREIRAEAPSLTLAQATPSTAAVPVTGWENTRTPKVAGRPLTLLSNESARASAVLPDGSGLLLGTSRALRKLDSRGTELWSVPMHTEVRALQVSQDGRVTVLALADGTLRWRRVADGAAVLSLLPLRDGRWVAWTEQGSYDASAGAEDLVGWLVTRPDGARADFFGVSRFRERFFRPDVIDRLLASLDVNAALAQANDVRQREAAAAEPEAREAVARMTVTAPVKQSLPPVVSLASAPNVEVSTGEVAVNFKVFVPPGGKLDELAVRIDGRPVDVAAPQLGRFGATGEAEGRLIVTLPKSEGVIQVFAKNGEATSMPASLSFKQTTAAPVAVRDRRPVLYLLAVGVSRYGDAEMNLPLAAKDARDFARSLQAQDNGFYKRVEVRVLLDEDATRSAVLAGLKWLQGATTSADVGMLFLAGHGVNDAADTYHFLPHDFKETNLTHTAVSEKHLRNALAGMKGKSLLFVDTCFAGKSVGKLSRRDLARVSNTFSSAELGVIVFSGSAPRQQSLESPEWGNGAFTKALVAGLGGKADFRREGVVTHKGLDYFVAHEVNALTRGRQTPVTAVPNGVSDYGLAAVNPPSSKSSKD